MPPSSFKNSVNHQELDIPLYTRTLNQTLHAHEVFFLCSEHFSGFLEDSKGNGKKFLISKAGHSYWLKDIQDADSFYMTWKQGLAKHDVAFPAIRQLVYASYEASATLEHLPPPKSAPPEGYIWIHEPEWSICFDSDNVFLASSISEKQLDEVEELLNQVAEASVSFSGDSFTTNVIGESISIDYECAVQRVKNYITEGDIFQANIARFWHTPFDKDDLLALYARLRVVNSAPFSCFVKADALNIISASPERLFSLSSSGIVETRPIAGTRKRSDGDADADAQLCAELLLSDKERAEHIMLVDLERNDLGRVCEPGSVEVNECMVVEQYATVQHIVSNVRGHLKDDHDVVDVFKAMFPGGTITGCPKVRCMEIIHELEGQARGPYTGSVGYIAWDGSADMNILIRTFWHHNNKLHWAAGAGIVADSNPSHERVETEHKAEGLLRALSLSYKNACIQVASAIS